MPSSCASGDGTRFDGSHAAFTIHASQKTITVSYIVWEGYFAYIALGMIPSLAYHLVQLIADTFIAHRFSNLEDRPQAD